jgi:hypothetical protein
MKAAVLMMPKRRETAMVPDYITGLVDEEFRHGDPRSIEYRTGMLDCLRARLHGVPLPRRYQVGTCQFDAWDAGISHGWAIYRRLAYGPASG